MLVFSFENTIFFFCINHGSLDFRFSITFYYVILNLYLERNNPLQFIFSKHLGIYGRAFLKAKGNHLITLMACNSTISFFCKKSLDWKIKKHKNIFSKVYVFVPIVCWYVLTLITFDSGCLNCSLFIGRKKYSCYSNIIQLMEFSPIIIVKLTSTIPNLSPTGFVPLGCYSA